MEKMARCSLWFDEPHWLFVLWTTKSCYQLLFLHKPPSHKLLVSFEKSMVTRKTTYLLAGNYSYQLAEI